MDFRVQHYMYLLSFKGKYQIHKSSFHLLSNSLYVNIYIRYTFIILYILTIPCIQLYINIYVQQIDFTQNIFSFKYKYNLLCCIYLHYICESCKVLSADIYITTNRNKLFNSLPKNVLLHKKGIRTFQVVSYIPLH